MTHELKILPKWFEDVCAQKKTFEIRKNDRNYNVGDTLILKEWCRGKYTGREVKRTVSYIYYGDGCYGLSDEYVVMAIRGARVVLDEGLCKMNGDSVDPEKCGDCISRKALLKKLQKVATISWKMKLECTAEIVWNQCIDYVKDAPSVEPERKTGHWEYTQDDYDPGVGNWHCSECKDIVVKCLTRVAEGRIPRDKYCSNCGCRMIKPQESGEV